MFSTKRRFTGASIIAFILASSGCSSERQIDSGIILQGVTVVNTRDGSLAKGMNVIVDGGRITSVSDEGFRAGGSATVVEAEGKFLVPGYLDMHVHSVESTDATPSDWPMMVASGITGVRQMSGSADIIARTRKLNLDSAAGRVLAPEVLAVSGAIFGGQAATDAGARDFVNAQKAVGADFMKMVGGSRPALLGLLDEAKKKQLPVSGHLPFTLSAAELSAAGMRSIEHLGGAFGLLLDCSSNEAAIRAAVLAVPPVQLGLGGPTDPSVFYANLYETFYRDIQGTYSEEKCKGLAATFVKNDTWQVPTLIRARTMAFGADAAYRQDPNLAYVSKATRALWSQLSAMHETAVRPSAAAAQQQFYPLMQRATKLLKDQKVKILAGTDAGGIWLIPGVSLHQEFRELATAGLSPLEVLQSTTLHGAEYLGRGATMGSVETGKRGDLVLLDANPLVDVANLGKIAGVMLNGKYFAKSELDKMKADVAQAHAAQPVGSIQAPATTGHQH